MKNKAKSPGPAIYPCVKKEIKNKVTTIYPTETRLLPTIKGRYNIKDKQQCPAPNAYPMIDGMKNDKKQMVDPTKKMIAGKNSPKYSIGIRHSPKQHILILKNDEF